MRDMLLRAALPGSEDLRRFAKSEEEVAYWKQQVALRFGAHGPQSPLYQSAQRNLIQAESDAGNWDEALRLALEWERLHYRQLTDERAENFLVIADCYLARNKVIEAREVIVPMVRGTMQPIFGQWTEYYHVLFISRLADLMELRGQKATDEEALRYQAFLESKQILGGQLTLTHACRLLLALCQEKQQDDVHALANYKVVYRFLMERNLLSPPEVEAGLCARIYRLQKEANPQMAAYYQARLIDLSAQHPDLSASIHAYLKKA